MSLKDRLNSKVQEQPLPLKEEKVTKPKIKFHKPEVQNIEIGSLGVLDMMLTDKEVNSIFVNGAKNIYVEKKGNLTKTPATYRDEVQLSNIVKKYLEDSGFDVEKKSFFNINHKKGINMIVTIPPLSDKVTLNLKIYNDKFASLKTMQESCCVSKEAALFLETLPSYDLNILVLGPKTSLKTTMLSALSKCIKDTQRAVIIDYKNEISTNKDNVVYYDMSVLENENQASLLIDNVINSKPDNIFVNDVKSQNLLQILNIASNNKGVVLNFEAEDFDNMVDIIYNSLLEKEKKPVYDDIKKQMLKAFDMIITTKPVQNKVGIISGVSQIIELGDDIRIEDIFYADDSNQLSSCGIIPNIYDGVFESTSLNQNIFYANYIHTYHKETNQEEVVPERKNINLEFLKKFKKNLNQSLENINETDKQNNEDDINSLLQQDDGN